MRLPWWLRGKESPCNAGDMGSIPRLGRSPVEGNTTPIFLPGDSHGQSGLAGYSPWHHKESEMTGQLTTHAREVLNLSLTFKACN